MTLRQVDRGAEHRQRSRAGRARSPSPGRRSRRAAPRSSGWCRRSRTGCRTPAAACPAGSCSPSSSTPGRRGAARRTPRPAPGRRGSPGAPTSPWPPPPAARRPARRRCRPRGVEHGHQQAEAGQPVLPADGGQVGRRHAGEDAAGAGARRARSGRLPLIRCTASSASRTAVHVGVEVPGGVPRVWVAPGDHEHLLALPDQVLDQAAAGGQVQRVELVDRRRDDQQRHLPDRARSAARYWISSSTSVRSTTAPGVTAMLRPTSNADASTISGIAGPGGQVRDQAAARRGPG